MDIPKDKRNLAIRFLVLLEIIVNNYIRIFALKNKNARINLFTIY